MNALITALRDINYLLAILLVAYRKG